LLDDTQDPIDFFFFFVSDKHTLRKQDYENYITGLLFPESQRRSFYAIRALNIEVGNVREMVKHSSFGDMRIQWWKESVLQLLKTPQKQSSRPQASPPISVIDQFIAKEQKPQEESKQQQQQQPQSPNQTPESSSADTLLTNPVLVELDRAIQLHKLSRIWFVRMFDRRVRDLYNDASSALYFCSLLILIFCVSFTYTTAS
jgi:phytoene/squalene synthetase